MIWGYPHFRNPPDGARGLSRFLCSLFCNLSWNHPMLQHKDMNKYHRWEYPRWAVFETEWTWFLRETLDECTQALTVFGLSLHISITIPRIPTSQEKMKNNLWKLPGKRSKYSPYPKSMDDLEFPFIFSAKKHHYEPLHKLLNSPQKKTTVLSHQQSDRSQISASSLLCKKSVAYSCETCVTMVHSMGWTIEIAASSRHGQFHHGQTDDVGHEVLLGGPGPPLWKIWVSQLGWLATQY